LLLAIAPGSGAAVTTFEPVQPPLQGFADLHNHQFANLGFGGRFLWGKPFDPGGIDAALPWCDYLPGKGPAPFQPALWVHGPGGVGDLVGNFLGGHLGHKVGGYPEFDGWPNFDSYSHQQVYVDWLHRAYVGGLRLMVMHAVNNKVLCQAIRGDLSCGDMDAVDRQIAAAKQLEQFVDQQSGGPGHGWYRIAYSGRQAREIISAGKLAVILGIEVSDLFGCAQSGSCTEAYVAGQVQKYYDLGVRHVFPVHEFDNGFAGASLFNPLTYIGNFIARGSYPQVRECSADGYEYQVSAGAQGFQNVQQILNFFVQLLGFNVPPPPQLGPGSGAHCNALGLTPLGQSLIRMLIGRNMVIDIDHMSALAANQTLTLALLQSYPGIVASHTGALSRDLGQRANEGQRTPDQLFKIRALGGMVGVILWGHADRSNTKAQPGSQITCGNSSATFAQHYLEMVNAFGGSSQTAVALGSDFNGLAGWPAPRFGDNACLGDKSANQSESTRVVYPFTTPLGVSLGKHVVGQRTFDINTDGVAEVGLLPDFIEDLRKQNVDVNPLYRSAEAYVRMWERADQHHDFLPVTTATASPAARSTTITLTAGQPAGWPVESITYSVSGAQTIPPTTTSFVQIVQLPFGGVTAIYRLPVVSFPLSAPGPYTITFFSTDELGNSETPKTLSLPQSNSEIMLPPPAS
jgi:microsomal dipeptidase-like Zn-dependent dipeptidase